MLDSVSCLDVLCSYELAIASPSSVEKLRQWSPIVCRLFQHYLTPSTSFASTHHSSTTTRSQNSIQYVIISHDLHRHSFNPPFRFFLPSLPRAGVGFTVGSNSTHGCQAGSARWLFPDPGRTDNWRGTTSAHCGRQEEGAAIRNKRLWSLSTPWDCHAKEGVISERSRQCFFSDLKAHCIYQGPVPCDAVVSIFCSWKNSS